MTSGFELVPPRVQPSLDPAFRPAVLANRNFRQTASAPLVLSLERSHGQISRFETVVFSSGHPRFAENLPYIERIVKFLLWARGGFRLYAGGPPEIAEHLRRVYAPDGERRFDYHFMSDQVYQQPLEILACTPAEAPPANESGKPLGRHLDGGRIGFDLGASDRKVSAVIDGRVVFSEEVIWEPRKHADPEYHYTEILTALRTAAAHLPRVDAIGGSSAGIYIDNRPMVASLFRSVPPERFDAVRSLFLRMQKEFGVPLEVINDGDATALAGAMSLEDTGVLGIAMGSSEAAGYVDRNGNILGWLNELAFAPVDYNPEAAVDEWSGDRGCGSMYFSQQCVFRLAPAAGIDIPTDITDAEKLAFVQQMLEAGHAGARRIWETMGVYLGYGLAHYADFYDTRHVLILGRCTSGSGGQLLLDQAQRVLQIEFPELVERLAVQLPDERSRRVGQSIAAASLPAID